MAIAFLAFVSLPATAQSACVTLPIQTAQHDMIFVQVKINGGDYLMLLDTGAEHTLVAEHTSHKAKGRDTSQGLIVEAKAIKAVIEFKDGPVIKTHILEANLDDLGKRFNDNRVKGILGQDVLREFSSVRIDYKANRIELVQ